MLNLDYNNLNELIEIANDESIAKYMEELKKVNCNHKYRQYLTEEDDNLFIMNLLIHEGEKRGIKVGEKHGLDEGKNLEILEIAKKLLREKVDSSIIYKSTGLSINQIKNIIL